MPLARADAGAFGWIMLAIRSFGRVVFAATLDSVRKLSLAAMLVGLVLVPATMLLLQGSAADAGSRAERQQSKIEPALTRLHELYILAGMPDDPAYLKLIGPVLPLSEEGFLEGVRIYDGLVLIEAAAVDAGEALLSLESLGLTQGTVFGHAISGFLPILAIPDLENIDGLTAVRLSRFETAGGSVTSQGDAALFADVARSTHGVDGTGVTIGVISDSYDCKSGAAADVASGDLPSDVVVQQEETSCTSGTDEGRAMMQLIHDVAPGADLIFQTGFLGAAAMAQGILDLEAAGADIIVDDVSYLTQPFFQDGVIAQAVDTVVASGVAYFSAAGNAADHSYESDFRSGSTYASGAFPSASGAPTFFGGVAHDFDPGLGVTEFQRVTFPVGITRITLQWDQPVFSVSGGSGSANEVDIYIFDDALTTVLAGSATASQGADPIEFLLVPNTDSAVTVRLGIFYDISLGGPVPGHIKYIHFDPLTIVDFPTDSSTIFGHSNAAGAGSVGAAAYTATPKFGTSPPEIESFSSLGGTTILFDTSGNSVSIDRQKPDFVAPDGTDTTFFGSDTDASGFPNFFGTSAAAPHAAAVAALMLDGDATLTPAEVYSQLESNAVDMGPAGFDRLTGNGLIDAVAALAFLEDPVVNAGAGQSASEGDTVSLAPASFTDPDATETFTATVDWGDGSSVVSGAVDQGAKTVSGSHIYADNGVFTVTVTVSDDDGGVGSDTFDVTVSNAPPVANAGADLTVQLGSPFLPVFTFTDPGSGDTHTATIEWGDGSATSTAAVDQASNTATSTHIYASNSTFTVLFIVADDEGATSSDTMIVDVNEAPVAVGGADQTAVEGTVLNLSAAAFTDADPGDAHTVTIDWGDGSATSTGTVDEGAGTATGSHAFADNGVFLISLTVSDDNGGTGNAATSTVTVSNAPPVANAGADLTAQLGFSFLPVFTFTDPGSGDTHTATIEWGDGSATSTAAVDQASNTATSTHIYASNSTFTVLFIVADDEGATSSDTMIVDVNESPVAVGGADQTAVEGTVLNLSAAAFTDADPGDAHTVTIDWGDGSATSTGTVDEGAGTATGSHAFADNGVFLISLTVSDDNGGTGNAATSTVTVANAPPVANAGADLTAQLGSSFSPVFTFTDPGSGDTHTATIEWGDGSATSTAAVDQASNTATSTHIYASNSTFTVLFIVTDDEGATSSDTMIVDVNEAPVAVGGADQTAVEGTVLNLSAAAFTDADPGDAHTVTIDWGDGSATSTGTVDEGAGTATGSHAFADNGVFLISLTVSDDNGGTGNAATSTVTVSNAPPVANAGPDLSVESGASVSPSFAFTDAGSADTHTATIDWGDGTAAAAGAVDQGAGTVSAAHTFGSAGVFTVLFTVTDDDGGSGSDSLAVTVTSPPAPSPSPKPKPKPKPTVSVPGTPRNVAATPGVGSAEVSWDQPQDDGGGAITSYRVLITPGDIVTSTQGSASSVVVSGLDGGVGYVFSVAAGNAAGLGPASEPTVEVVVFGLPGAPTDVSVTADVEAIVVTWSPPGNTGGKLILSYTISAESSAGDAVSASSGGETGSITLTGLTPGIAYTISVVARNAIGPGPASPGIETTVLEPVEVESTSPPDEETGLTIQPSVEETDALQAAVDEAIGGGLEVTDAQIELSVSEGTAVILLPVEGATTEGSVSGIFNLEIGGLMLETTDGVGTASFAIGKSLSVEGEARLNVSAAGIQVEIIDPRLIFTPEPPDVSTLTGGSDDVELIGIDFEVDLVRLPVDARILVTYSKDIGDLEVSAQTTFRLQAENTTGSIENAAEDVAFVVTVVKSGITNADLGSNRASLVVSRVWFDKRVGEGKIIVIVKQNDDGDLFHAEAVCEADGEVERCVAEFTGVAGGFSTFGLIALTVMKPPPAATPVPEPVLIPGPGITGEPVITNDAVIEPTATPAAQSPAGQSTAVQSAVTTPSPTPEPGPEPAPEARSESPTPMPATQPEAAPTPQSQPAPTASLSELAGGRGSAARWLWAVFGVSVFLSLLVAGGAVVRFRRA